MKKKVFLTLITLIFAMSVNCFAWSNMMVDSTRASSKIIALKTDGTVLNYGYNLFDSNALSNLGDIKEIACEEVLGNVFFVLKADKTVKYVYKFHRTEYDVVETWTDIIDIDAGNEFVAGVKTNGTVVVAGKNAGVVKKCANWTDIKSIYAKEDTLIGIDSQGKVYVESVYADIASIKNWTGMKKVIFDTRCFWGLDLNGNLVSSSSVYKADRVINKELLGNFVDIDCMSAYAKSGYYSSIMALKSDGTLLNVHNYNTGIGNYKAVVALESVDSIVTGTSEYTAVLKNGSIVSNVVPVTGPQWNLNIDIKVNGNYVYCDVPAFIENGRTMVPIRAISEALNADVSYDDATKTAIIQKGDNTIKIPMNSSTAYVNGVAHTLEASAKNVSDRIFVPVRFVSEGLKSNVDWDEYNYSVIITE